MTNTSIIDRKSLKFVHHVETTLSLISTVFRVNF